MWVIYTVTRRVAISSHPSHPTHLIVKLNEYIVHYHPRSRIHSKTPKTFGVVRKPLQWRLNERNGVSNHQRLDCLLSRLFRRRSKKTSKLRLTGLCGGNSPVAGGFPSQRASFAENVSICWRHAGITPTPTPIPRDDMSSQWPTATKPNKSLKYSCKLFSNQWSTMWSCLVMSLSRWSTPFRYDVSVRTFIMYTLQTNIGMRFTIL